ncbi:MAG: hypothetical protein QGI63_02455 [Rhodospirillales bacterium]|nr:hypothetical protein [Rhodospirillales bacterium]MDP6773109.1 hypothetical protein [Rhodospirillales bacterium]
MDASSDPARSGAPTIPLADALGAGSLAIVEAEPGRARDIMEAGRRHYGVLALRLGDRVSRRWLEKTANPYRQEIEALAAHMGEPGCVLLNLSYEWTCTSGVGPAPGNGGTGGSRLLRTLDWPLDGLGRNLVVAKRAGDAGAYFDVTWPGFVGVATAMAPGRFSAAINQPPMRRLTPSCGLDWVLNRWRAWRARALPPSHLLRRVFDECRTYAEAKAMLSAAPICIPAFFTLSGMAPGEGCVVERQEDGAAVHEAPVSMANHWLSFDDKGWARGLDSASRLQAMDGLRERVGDDFSWVVPPILNETTRVAVVANAAAGRLLVQGWEADGPATQVFSL